MIDITMKKVHATVKSMRHSRFEKAAAAVAVG
jgi:hypothetical protein